MTTPTTFASVFNVTLPPEGPRTVPVNIDFATTLSNDIDFTNLINTNWLSYVSGVYFDNSDNSEDVTLFTPGTNQSIIIPASSQGWFPLHVTNPPLISASVSANGGLCKLQFLNFPVWPYVVGGGGGSSETDVNIAEVGGIAVGGPNLPVEIIAPNPVPVEFASPTITDYSAALTGGNDELIAAGDGARYVAVYNPLANAPVTVNLAGGDATMSGVVLAGGGSLTIDQGCANAITLAGTVAQTVNVFGGVI